MTLPRPVLIALLGLALCAAAFLATRSANDTGSAVTTTPAAPNAAARQPRHPADRGQAAQGAWHRPGDAPAKH